MGGLEGHGFRLMDALVTYTTRPGKEPPNAVREVGTIRPFREAGRTGARRDRRSRLSWLSRTVSSRPASRSDARCDAFYVEWARQCVAGTMADMIFVSEGADGRLLGFLAFRRREPVSTRRRRAGVRRRPRAHAGPTRLARMPG